jgi:hypothetical protein
MIACESSNPTTRTDSQGRNEKTKFTNAITIHHTIKMSKAGRNA